MYEAKQLDPGEPPRPAKRSADEMLDTDDDNTESSSDDDEFLLVESPPKKPRRLPDGHHLQSLVPDLVALGLKTWNETSTTSLDRDNNPLSFSIPLHSNPLHSNRRARQADSDCSSWGHGDVGSKEGDSVKSYSAHTDNDRPDTVLVRPTYGGGHKLLACPFYRFDPKRHHACLWEAELPNIWAVKQHVVVSHRPPDYCPVCYQRFDNSVDRDQHIVARSCNKKEAPADLFTGMLEDRADKLLRGRGKRAKAGTVRQRSASPNKDEEWFRIWKILFPEAPRPDSTYLSTPVELQASALRSFWEMAGHQLVAGVVEERGILRREELKEEADLAALSTSVLEGMMEKFKTGYQGQA